MKFSTHRNLFYRCRLFVFFLFILINCSLLHSLDFLLRPKGYVFVPIGEGNISTVSGEGRYDLGGGGNLGFEFDFSSIWSNPIGFGFSIGIDAGMITNPLMISGIPRSVLTYSVGGSLGLSFFPFSRLLVRVDGTAGVYRMALDEYIGPVNLFWNAGGELGFRFTPTFILSAGAGWRQFEDSRAGYNPSLTGFSAGLTAQLTIQAGRTISATPVEGILDQPEPVYPALLQLYQTNPVGTLTIRNRENAEIRNVRVSFRASQYTSSEYFCGSIPLIQRGRNARIPLLADFSSELLRFTDNSRILGEIVVRYNFLGQERVSVSAVTVACHNRNVISEGDISALAAFISPTSPEVLEYSKYIIGLARSRTRFGHNQNLQYAIWLYEGLRASGISIGETHSSDYEAQFPAETLAFGKGTSRDIALLFSAALESVGISSAFIKAGTDYIVAVNLAMGEAAAETMFNNMDSVLILGDEVWLPVAMSSFNDGFLTSWLRGNITINNAYDRGDDVDFVTLQEAWADYPPAPLPDLGTRVGRVNSDVIQTEANSAIDQYVFQEILPLIWRTEAQLRLSPIATLYNRLGNLLVRAGRFAEGKLNYERAAQTGSVAGMNNRGNIALHERDYITAEYWFTQALTIDSSNVTAQRGLDRVEERK
jgi:hypothetical protein